MANNESANAIPYLFDQFRKRGKYVIGGTPHTAKTALKKFPRLIGLFEPSGRIETKSVEDKFRRWFRSGRFKSSDFEVDAPLFLEVNSALAKTFRNYICDDPIIGNYDTHHFSISSKKNIKKMMRENLGTKAYLNLHTLMKKLNDGEEDTQKFYSGEYEILPGTDLEDTIHKIRKKVIERLEKMETAAGSGWALVKIQSVKLHFAEFKPLRGSSYVELPGWIKNKKAVINILNKTDDECFKWCVTRAIHPIGKNSERITKKLREQSKLFDWTGVNFPTSFEDISRFEKNNNVSVKVLGCDDDTQEIVCLRNGNGRYKLAVTLLLFEGHYCVVKNMSRLTSRQLTCDNAAYFCDYCSFTHRKKDTVLKHQELCTGDALEPERVFPNEGSTVNSKISSVPWNNLS